MNKTYRLKFSKRLHQFIVVSELATGHDRNSGENRQSSIVNRQSSIVNRQSSIVNRQSS